MTLLLRLLAAAAFAAPIATRRAAGDLTALAVAAAVPAAVSPAALEGLSAALIQEAGLDAAEPAMGPRGGRSARASGKAASARRKKKVAAAGGSGGDGTDDGDRSKAAAAPSLDFDGAAARMKTALAEPVARLRDLVKEAVLAGGANGVASISAGPRGVTVGLEPSAKREDVDAFFEARLGEGTASRLSYAVEPPRPADQTFEQRRAEQAARPAGPAELVFGALPVQLLEESLWRKLRTMKVPAEALAKMGPDARPYFEIILKGTRRDLRRVENLVHDPERGPHFYGPVPVQIRFRQTRGR